MATFFGGAAIVLGLLGFVGTFVSSYKRDMVRSTQLEMCAIGWFILATMLLR